MNAAAWTSSTPPEYVAARAAVVLTPTERELVAGDPAAEAWIRHLRSELHETLTSTHPALTDKNRRRYVRELRGSLRRFYVQCREVRIPNRQAAAAQNAARAADDDLVPYQVKRACEHVVPRWMRPSEAGVPWTPQLVLEDSEPCRACRRCAPAGRP